MLKIQIIETVIAIATLVIIRILTHRSIDKVVQNNILIKSRSKIVKKVIDLLIFIILFIVIALIFGVKQSELLVFIGSVLTVLGIALFAQWSILSNITSGIILFFNHSVKLDDVIIVLDKDYAIEGRISNIGLFFVLLKTSTNEQITIPNSVFLYKMIKKKNNEHI